MYAPADGVNAAIRRLSSLRRAARDPAAYDLTMRANWLAWDQASTRAEAKRCFERAIELDPEYALPHSLLAMILRLDWQRGIAGSPALLDRAFALAKRESNFSTGESTSHVAMGFLYLERRCFDQALKPFAVRRRD